MDIVADGNSVVPVASLLLFRDSSLGEILLGVRRPTATSSRHPDVLSTPTMRVPLRFLAEAVGDIGEQSRPLTIGEFRPLSGRREAPLGSAYSLADPATFLAEALMCRKLGLGEVVVSGRLTARATVLGIAYDRIFDESGGYENTLMMTVRVVPVERLADDPVSTASYSRLEWVDSSTVGTAVAARDPLLLLPDASVWEVCLHGLCVRSAAFFLERPRERAGEGDV